MARQKRRNGLLGRWVTDPRTLGGKIREGEVDATRALLLDQVAVAEVIPPEPTKPPVVAVEVGGRISKTNEEASLLILASPDAVAMMVAEMLRASQGSSYALKAALADRLGNLKENGER